MKKIWKHKNDTEIKELKTIDHLRKYLENELYDFSEISIAHHHAPEGIVIEKTEQLHHKYHYSYSERGKKEVLKSFENEEDLVKYAYTQLTEDKWLRAHLVAWVWDEKSILAAENKLRKKGIAFERNDIPNYRKGVTAYRLFVFGKDALQAEFLKTRYLKNK